LNTSGAGWSEFLTRMQRVGDEIVGENYPAAPEDRADGLHHLSLLVEASLNWHTNFLDPDFPRFCQINDTPEIADNRFASIRGDATYVLSGNIASLFDVNISVHDGWVFLGDRQVWGDLARADLDVAQDGSFELILSPDPHPGNWLRLDPAARILQIREYFYDWERDRPGTFEIVRVGSENQAPARKDPAELDQHFIAAADYVEGYLRSHRQVIEEWFPPANTISQPVSQPGGNANILYGPGRFSLRQGEALLIEFRPPDARAWTIQWLHTPWYENPDMANRITSIMGRDAHIDSDGRCRIVLSAQDPGVMNWIDCGGYEEGVLMLRWIWSENNPEVDTTLQRLDQIASWLPPDTPRTDENIRATQIARRRSHLAHRRR
jgi:hypothetical protein